jgi:hypothetical protein
MANCCHRMMKVSVGICSRAAPTSDHDPRASVVAFKAVAVNSPERRVTAGFPKDNSKVASAAGGNCGRGI